MKATPIFVAAGLVLAASALAQNTTSRFIGKPAPRFIMKDVSGKTITNASLRGKVVLLDFWATWCGPCKAASPAMQKLHETYGRKGLLVIGADTFERVPDPKPGVMSYKKKHGYSYTFTLENDGLAESLGISGIPQFVLLDKKGNVQFAATGVPPNGAAGVYDVFSRQVQKLLAQ